MHVETLAILRCPACEESLKYATITSDGELSADQRLVDATVRCGCGASFAIAAEILDLRAGSRRADDEHKREQSRFFTEEAEAYERDVVNSPFYRALDEITVHRWAKQLPDRSRVLDIGSGTGRVAIRLAGAGHRVIAVDLTAELLRRAQEKARTSGVSASIDFVLADAEHLPVADLSFDAAVAHGVLHHLRSPEQVIRVVGRALKPGGRWFSLDPHRSPLRGVFDALMRRRRLWQEEAAPDSLQTEHRLSRWCWDAQIVPAVGYSCILPPHLLLALPRTLLQPTLDLTDRLIARSAGRRLAGVIFVAGRKRPVGTRTQQSSRVLHAAVAALALVGMALASGLWSPDPAVAAKSPSYYMGGLDEMLVLANAPARHRATLINTESGPLDEVSLDDVGYATAIQIASLAGLTVTAPGLSQAHAVGFLAASVLFAWSLGLRYRSIVVSIGVMAVMLALASGLSMLIYGQVSNQTSTSLFPPLVLPALLLWSTLLSRRDRLESAVGVAITVAMGALVGTIDLVRHSHGLAAMLALALIVLLGLRGLRPRAVVAAALIGGYMIATVLFPAALKIHRDVQLGRWQGFNITYLQRPPAHHIYYTLLTAVGRYPNALGLYYEDRSVDDYIRKMSPNRPESAKQLVDDSALLFVDYVRSHPVEYAGILVRGALELPSFVAYTTFMAPKRWDYAWPSIVPGIQVDPRDVARYGSNLLMNFRPSYLRLDPLEWLGFLAAWAAIGVSAILAVLSRGPSRLVIAAALVYLAMVAWPRALVPVQGMDFIFAFWCTALLCAVHLLRSGPPHPLRAER